jgi:hypothetical protein
MLAKLVSRKTRTLTCMSMSTLVSEIVVLLDMT